ncbi:MAG: RNA polymerase sigma-I factor [Bacillota bacterium]
MEIESFKGKRKGSDEAINENESKINRVVLKIQNGDFTLRNNFINKFKPFILNKVSVTLGRFIVPENSEEYSVALSAFNEAIDKFDEKKYHNFMSFAGVVVKRRVIDYLRANSKENKVLPFAYLDEEDHSFEEKYLSAGSEEQFHKVEYKEEMECFEKMLEQFGITLEDLVEYVPKHKDARESSIRIARILSEDERLFGKLNEKHCLPAEDLAKAAGVSKRTVQRNSKFIIAVAIVFKLDFETFKSYVSEYKKKSSS